jgi:hypothetical protein
MDAENHYRTDLDSISRLGTASFTGLGSGTLLVQVIHQILGNLDCWLVLVGGDITTLVKGNCGDHFLFLVLTFCLGLRGEEW